MEIKSLQEKIETRKLVERAKGILMEMSPEDLARLGIECLPGNLGEALDELRKDTVIQEALGPHVYEKFLAAKTMEWEEYRIQVHPWEREMYLARY